MTSANWPTHHGDTNPDLDTWYKQDYKDGACVYQLDASGEIAFELGPFFVRGTEKATELHMILCGIKVMKDAMYDAQIAVHEATDLLTDAQAYLTPQRPMWRLIETWRVAHPAD